MPPTPCTAKTSSESSILNLCLTRSTAPKQTRLPAAPSAIPPSGPTKPEAGVMVARPATTPVTTPIILERPKRILSSRAQTRPAVEAEMWVTKSAMAASPLAARALPPLKPYQPTQSMPAPIMVMPGLCGGCRSRG